MTVQTVTRFYNVLQHNINKVNQLGRIVGRPSVPMFMKSVVSPASRNDTNPFIVAGLEVPYNCTIGYPGSKIYPRDK